MIIRWDILLNCVVKGFFEALGFCAGVMLLALALRFAGVFK
jgi:hypothetical protein